MCMYSKLCFGLMNKSVNQDRYKLCKAFNTSYTSNSYNTKIVHRINSVLIERKLVQPNERILIAVSGGQDSICLLKLLYRLCPNWKWKLGIIFCDHGWYLNSTTQGTHVSKLANSMQIDYYQVTSIKSICTETLSRKWRYQSIQRVATCHQYDLIMTAHSASDRIETLIHNVIRGSGTNGLKSIGWKRTLNPALMTSIPVNDSITYVYWQDVAYQQFINRIELYKIDSKLYIIRPLLSITRTDLRILIKKWNLMVWSDLTNQNIKLQRNRIRQQLLPYLRLHFNANIDHILNNLTELLHSEAIYLETLAFCIRINAESTNWNNRRSKHCRVLNIQILRALPIAIQRRVIRQFLHTYLNTSPKFDQIEQIRLAYSHSATLVTQHDQFSTNPIHSVRALDAQYALYLSNKSNVKVYQDCIVLITAFNSHN